MSEGKIICWLLRPQKALLHCGAYTVGGSKQPDRMPSVGRQPVKPTGETDVHLVGGETLFEICEKVVWGNT